MGLDISYFKGLKEIRPLIGDEELDWQANEKRFYINKDFPGRNGSIKEGVVYSYEDKGAFWAGSYKQWREELAKVAGYPAVEYKDRFDGTRMRHDAAAWGMSEGPFWELIHFSDCEGTIGPEPSAKLAQDFARYQAKADAHPDEWWRRLYATWRTAFETAAQNGAVDFH